jgi:hypothetical protein
MDFLDNLENSLKNLESQEERDPAALRRQEDVRKRAEAAAPWAEKLKASDYTKSLFEKAAVAGHKMRSKVYMAWLDSVLRLEARGRWCELRPTATGIVAEFVKPDGEISSSEIDLSSDPEILLGRWLDSSDKNT